LADLADYQWLIGSVAANLLDELAACNDPVHRQLSRLRKTISAERARLIVQQAELRQRAQPKFGELAGELFYTDLALQQATDLWTARYKAGRVPRGVLVDDYCCGIGGDLLALAERGPTTGWDRAPELALLAATNLRAVDSAAASHVCTDAVESQTPRQLWHLDPDRRTEGRRSTRLEWHSPGPDVVQRWLDTNPDGILKLAPATVVPDSWSEQSELEWVTFDRQCRQQIAWFGSLASAVGMHRATNIPKTADEAPASFIGSPAVDAPIATKVARYLYDTDPAIRAAGLTGALAADQGLQVLDRGAAYVTGDSAVDHPLLARFEVLEQLPVRVKPLREYFANRHIGTLEIKKRGITTDLERLRKQLTLRGDESATLLLTRLGTREIAVVARRR